MSKSASKSHNRVLQRKPVEIQTSKTLLQKRDHLLHSNNFADDENDTLCEITSINMRNPRMSQVSENATLIYQHVTGYMGPSKRNTAAHTAPRIQRCEFRNSVI